MNATIATTLSMNARPFTSGLQAGEKGLTSFGQQVKNLQAESKRFKDQAEQAASMTAAQYKKLAGTMQGVQWNRFVAEMTVAAKTEQALNTTTGQLSIGMRQLAASTEMAASSRRRLGQVSNIGAAGGRGGAGNGLLELSRGLEDFAISASVGGIGMGIRGATNNINAYLSRLGTLGAVASIAVTAGATLISYFERTKKATDDAAESFKKAQDAFSQFRSEVDARVQKKQGEQEFARMVGGLGSTADANKEMDARKRQFADLTGQIKALQVEEKKAFDERWKWQDVPGRETDFAVADSAHAAVQQKITELLKERKKLEEEIGVISKKYYELNDKALTARTEKERAAAVEKKKQEADLAKQFQQAVNERVKGDATAALGMVDKIGQQLAPQGFGDFQRFMMLADQRAQIQGMAIPMEMKMQLSSLLTQAGMQDGSKGFQGFATAAEYGTAAGGRLVEESRARARMESEQKKTTAKLTELVTMLRDFIRQIPDPPEDAVKKF